MTYAMALDEATSSADEPDFPSYCLLAQDQRDGYHCLEVASNMGAAAPDMRVAAYWQHHLTHAGSYTHWAARHRLLDLTILRDQLQQRAEALVHQSLLAFQAAVEKGRYIPAKGRPCLYMKHVIWRRFQDMMRRGTPVATADCLACWESHGGHCTHFDDPQPWRSAYRRCYRPPVVTSFEETVAVFTAAGLQNAWPPELSARVEAPVTPYRPVEDQALTQVMIECVQRLMIELLSDDQYTVLIEVFGRHRSHGEVAHLIGTTPNNVSKLKRRALDKLKRALISDLGQRAT